MAIFAEVWRRERLGANPYGRSLNCGPGAAHPIYSPALSRARTRAKERDALMAIPLRAGRAVFAALTIGVAASVDAEPSFAETNRPWCVQYIGRDGGSENCSFTSYEQCMMTGGPGTGGICVQNPWYLWYGPNGSNTAGQGGRVRKRSR